MLCEWLPLCEKARYLDISHNSPGFSDGGLQKLATVLASGAAPQLQNIDFSMSGRAEGHAISITERKLIDVCLRRGLVVWMPASDIVSGASSSWLRRYAWMGTPSVPAPVSAVHGGRLERGGVERNIVATGHDAHLFSV